MDANNFVVVGVDHHLHQALAFMPRQCPSAACMPRQLTEDKLTQGAATGISVNERTNEQTNERTVNERREGGRTDWMDRGMDGCVNAHMP